MIKTAIAHDVFKGRIACIVGVLGRFLQHVCPNAISQFTYSCFLGDFTQLGNIHVFFRPFSAAFMSHRPHNSHTHASRVNQPNYAIGLTSVWEEEPLPIVLSMVVLIALLVCLGRLQQHFWANRANLCNRTENSVVRGASHCSSCFQRSV